MTEVRDASSMRVPDDEGLAPSPEPPELRKERRRQQSDQSRQADAGNEQPPAEREIGENQGGGIPGAIGGGQSGQGGG